MTVHSSSTLQLERYDEHWSAFTTDKTPQHEVVRHSDIATNRAADVGTGDRLRLTNNKQV